MDLRHTKKISQEANNCWESSGWAVWSGWAGPSVRLPVCFLPAHWLATILSSDEWGPEERGRSQYWGSWGGAAHQCSTLETQQTEKSRSWWTLVTGQVAGDQRCVEGANTVSIILRMRSPLTGCPPSVAQHRWQLRNKEGPQGSGFATDWVCKYHGFRVTVYSQRPNNRD